MGAGCDILGLFFLLFPLQGQLKGWRKWQLHGSAGLVPLAAVGDNWEDVKGVLTGSSLWSHPALGGQRLLLALP